MHSTSVIESFHVGSNPDALPTGVDDLYIEVKETTSTTTNPRTALLSSGSSDRTLCNPDPLAPIRTTRTSTKRFERPDYLHILAHAIFCCIAYPIIYVGTVATKGKSLFWARVIVGLWCAGIGVVIGWSLVAFATKYAEAASKHTSRVSLLPPRGCPTSCLSVSAKHGQL